MANRRYTAPPATFHWTGAGQNGRRPPTGCNPGPPRPASSPPEAIASARAALEMLARSAPCARSPKSELPSPHHRLVLPPCYEIRAKKRTKEASTRGQPLGLHPLMQNLDPGQVLVRRG